MRFVTERSFGIGFEVKDFDGARYFLPGYARNRPACRAIRNDTYYELQTHQLVAQLLQLIPGNIVHGGAFFGDMLPSFSRACGAAGTVYAFEPLLENYVLARLCVDHNQLANVALFNVALADSAGPRRVVRETRPGIHAGGAARLGKAGEVTAASMTVDGLGLARLSILHLDVEGFELRALIGAHTTLRALRPIVLVEDVRGDCGALLASVSYGASGSIPGLGVWCPLERPDLAAAIQDFIPVA